MFCNRLSQKFLITIYLTSFYRLWEMLIEQIVEFEIWGPGPPDHMGD